MEPASSASRADHMPRGGFMLPRRPAPRRPERQEGVNPAWFRRCHGSSKPGGSLSPLSRQEPHDMAQDRCAPCPVGGPGHTTACPRSPILTARSRLMHGLAVLAQGQPTITFSPGSVLVGLFQVLALVAAFLGFFSALRYWAGL